MQVRVEDAELLTEWQRTQAEFKQRRKLAGDLGAKDKMARMKAFQDRLRSGSFASASAAAPAAADGADGAPKGEVSPVPDDLEDHYSIMPLYALKPSRTTCAAVLSRPHHPPQGANY